MLQSGATTHPAETLRSVLRVAVVLGALVLGGCRRDAPDEPPSQTLPRHTNVLLITLDTTRADRIGCYGCADARTPVLDALAARGVLFERAQAQVPLTLPSHASMLTGRYPKEIGIRVNGRHALGPTTPTLAEAFQARGYRTGAFIAAGVIDARYGLDRGFDVYGDNVAGVGERRTDDVQRRGDAVTDEALAWLNDVAGEPFFGWIHYYDPHDPYDPPPPYDERLPTPYDGEIAFMDAQIGRVTRRLDERQLTAKTLLVLVGDHGESFGEHGTHGHTTFIYQTNLHVPLVFAHPALSSGMRSTAVVENVDVFPTVMELMGWPLTEKLLSRSLAEALGGGEIESCESYAESHHVNWAYGWAEQRSLTTERWKYISSTRPELYDLRSDPGERRSVLDDFPQVGRQMRELLQARFSRMTLGEASPITLDEEARRTLESLGYVSGGTRMATGDFLTAGLPDPKDMLPVRGLVGRATAALKTGDAEQAATLFAEAAELSPRSVLIQYQLGQAERAIEHFDRAIAALHKAIELDPEYVPALTSMALTLTAMGRHDEARKYFEAALALDADNARAHRELAVQFRQQGELDRAVDHLERALQAEPRYVAALTDLSIICDERGEAGRALELALRAAEADPNGYKSQKNAGVLLRRAGRATEAAEAFLRAVELNPKLARHMMGQAGKLLSSGETEAAGLMLEALAAEKSVAADARYQLALLAADAADTDRAIEAYRSVLEVKPAHEPSVMALVNTYLQTKQVREAVKVLQTAVDAGAESVAILRALSSLLATAPYDDVRDGPRAVKLASRAAALTEDEDPVLLATLAAAYAESGDFDAAIQTGTEAAELARTRGVGRLAEFIDRQLEGYRSGRPFHDPSLRR